MFLADTFLEAEQIRAQKLASIEPPWELDQIHFYPAFHQETIDEYDRVVVEFETEPEQFLWRPPFIPEGFSLHIGSWEVISTQEAYEQSLVNSIPEEAAKEGATPLFLLVTRDESPTWRTNVRVEFWAHGSPIAASTLAAIIIGALGALGISFFAWRIISSGHETRQAELQREREREEFTERLLEEGYTPEEVIPILRETEVEPAEGSPWDVLKTPAIIVAVAAAAMLILPAVIRRK